MIQKQLNEILRKHKLWLDDEEGGERADLWSSDMRGSDMRYCNLMDCNLMESDLRYCNLMGANLWGTNGNLRAIKSVFLETWPITYTYEYLQIGCQRHPIADWWQFSDEQIARMDPQALCWWRKWKDTLRTLIEMSPAVPTKHEDAES